MPASRTATVEVVRTDAGHRVRIRTRNGRIQWTTEVYTTRSGAVRAIAGIATAVEVDGKGVARYAILGTDEQWVPIHYMDHRLSTLARRMLARS